jgi:hypothetical protein
MGTSSNQRSRSIPTWSPARAVLGLAGVTSDAQSLELWRAALGDQEALVRERLSSEVMRFACELASQKQPPTQSISRLDDFLMEAPNPSLFDSIAKRALARAASRGGGRETFGAEVFAETASYLASREIPSYVGGPGRISNVSEAVSLKSELQEHARSAATSASLKGTTPQRWRAYVADVLAALTSKAK